MSTLNPESLLAMVVVAVVSSLLVFVSASAVGRDACAGNVHVEMQQGVLSTALFLLFASFVRVVKAFESSFAAGLFCQGDGLFGFVGIGSVGIGPIGIALLLGASLLRAGSSDVGKHDFQEDDECGALKDVSVFAGSGVGRCRDDGNAMVWVDSKSASTIVRCSLLRSAAVFFKGDLSQTIALQKWEASFSG